MIYVTGDMHGDISRFKHKALRRLKKNDYLLVCGDFGFIWDGSPKEKKLLKWIGKRRYHVLFVEGTHDNLDLLGAYPSAEWNGGPARQISGKLRHLCRGGVFTLEDKTVLAFGGGESGDISNRALGSTWWSAELPDEAEIEAARQNLQAHGNKVDYILTHQCSRKIKKFLTMLDNDANILDTFFDEVRENCSYRRWYFGSYHINKQIPPGEMALFKAVLPVTADKIDPKLL